jgi:hypothetical protein
MPVISYHCTASYSLINMLGVNIDPNLMVRRVALIMLKSGAATGVTFVDEPIGAFKFHRRCGITDVQLLLSRTPQNGWCARVVIHSHLPCWHHFCVVADIVRGAVDELVALAKIFAFAPVSTRRGFEAP